MEGEDAVDDIQESDIHSVLIDVGVNLLVPPPTVDELLHLLEDVELILGFLGQDPSCALQDALLPTKNGLVSDKLLRHPHMDVNISVLSCIHELIRITAPTAPYAEDIMKEIFHQTLIAFEKLTLFSGHCYTKALHILETVAKFRSCVILLDIGCDALIIQMFQVLLDTIRSNHPDVVFSNMEVIMTWLIEESDEISMDLLKPLLSSVNKQNKSLLAGRLGMKVLQNCSGRVKPSLIKAVEQMRQDIECYTDTVASIWPEANAEINVMKKAATDASDLLQMLRDGKFKKSGNHKSTLVDGNASKTLKCRGIFQPLQIIANGSVQPNNLGSEEAHPKRRGRKLKESHKHSAVTGFKTSSEASQKRNNYGKLGSSSKNLSLERSPLQSQPVLMDHNSLPRGQQKKKGNMPNSLVKKEGDCLRDTVMKHKKTAQNCDAEGSPLMSCKRSGVKEYCEELIGSRVKVWWPKDREYYEGIVKSYDPMKKKHKITYLDGDVETLRLKKERWILLDDLPDEQDQEATLPISSSFELIESGQKEESLSAYKIKQENEKKKDDASSSKKRSRPQVRKSESEHTPSSTLAIIAIKNELDTREDEDDDVIRYSRRPRY